MERQQETWVHLLCLNLIALYAPAVVVIPQLSVDVWVVPLYPVLGPTVLTGLSGGTGLAVGLCLLLFWLGLVVLGSYGWFRGTAVLGPRSRLTARVMPAVCLLLLSWAQGAFVVYLANGLSG